MSRTKLLTVAELADRLRISKRSGYRVVREMEHRTIGKRLFVESAELERFLESKLRPGVPRPPSRRGRS